MSENNFWGAARESRADAVTRIIGNSYLGDPARGLSAEDQARRDADAKARMARHDAFFGIVPGDPDGIRERLGIASVQDYRGDEF